MCSKNKKNDNLGCWKVGLLKEGSVGLSVSKRAVGMATVSGHPAKTI
jgi:hypothetical protein